MARYRKVYPRLWNDPDFLKLNDGERVLTLYILTGPQTNRIGLFKFSLGQAAEDLDTHTDTLAKRMGKVCDTYSWRFDPASRTLWIPSWWKWNPPDSIKVFIGALADLHEIPETPFLQEFRANHHDLPDSYTHTLEERIAIPIPIGTPIQEQEQYQYQEHSTGAPNAPETAPTETEKAKDDGRAPYAFLKVWCELYPEHRSGAKYHVEAAKEVPIVRKLLKTYDHDRLVNMARCLLTTQNEWIAQTDRSIGILSVKANWLNERLAEYEARHGNLPGTA